MFTYNVYSRNANSTEKTLVGQFQGTSKKEVCSKVASLLNGLFISAYRVGENQPQTFDSVEQDFENLSQAIFESRVSK